jgi:hypothetical protein
MGPQNEWIQTPMAVVSDFHHFGGTPNFHQPGLIHPGLSLVTKPHLYRWFFVNNMHAKYDPGICTAVVSILTSTITHCYIGQESIHIFTYIFWFSVYTCLYMFVTGHSLTQYGMTTDLEQCGLCWSCRDMSRPTSKWDT